MFSLLGVAVSLLHPDTLFELRAGAPVMMFVCVLAALLPDIAEKFRRAFFVKHDVAVSVDPLAPDAHVLTNGIVAAMHLCRDSATRAVLRVSYIPDAKIRLKLHAGKSLCDAEISGDSGTRASNTTQFPAFTCGAAPAIYELNKNENQFLTFSRNRDGRISISPLVCSLRTKLVALGIFALLAELVFAFDAGYFAAFAGAARLLSEDFVVSHTYKRKTP